MYVCRCRDTNLVSFVIFVLVSFISRLLFCSVFSLFLFGFIFSGSLVEVRIFLSCVVLDSKKDIYFGYIFNPKIYGTSL